MRGILPGHQQRCLERGEAGDEEGDDEPHGQTETEVQVGGLETPQSYNVSIKNFIRDMVVFGICWICKSRNVDTNAVVLNVHTVIVALKMAS